MAEAPQRLPRRRWRYQFSLRSLLVVMGLVAAVTVYVTNHFRAREANTRLYRFIQAVQLGNSEEVDRFLRLDPRLAHLARISDSETSFTPLQYAYRSRRNLAVVERILHERPDINQRSSAGTSILHLAVERQSLQDVIRFVQLGADVNARDFNGETPLHFAARGDHRDHARAIAQALLDAGADPNSVEATSHQTPLHTSARHGNSAVAATLLAAGVDVNVRDANGRTPLHISLALYGGFVTSDFFISQGANLAARDDEGWIPGQESKGVISSGAWQLWWEEIVRAHDLGQIARLEECFSAAPEVVNVRNSNGTTFLEHAIYSRVDIVEFLLSHGSDVNARTANNGTPLHSAVWVSAPAAVIDRLIDTGANIEARNGDGQTPLHFAAHVNAAALRLLMDRGANVLAVDKVGATVLDYAVEGGSIRTAELLLERGHPPTMLYAAMTGNIGLMEELADGDQEQLDRAYTLSGTRPLHAAVQGGVPAIRWLLQQGVDKNPLRRMLKESNGDTPLMLALSHALTDVAIVLIDHGANVNQPGSAGRYPVHAVIERGRDPEILSALIAHGADLTLRYEGKTAMEMAQASKSKHREEYLRILNAATEAESR